ncbi:MAG: ASPIC/UnbV domain-containing protein [Pirellulaceae bacterium]|nr:ASPIC/UnbV domain-containing protein [Pirellulaceae bacterium]
MAQSPGQQRTGKQEAGTAEGGAQRNKYFQGWLAVSQLLYEGASWSGNERHCCFLNTRQDRFADVSAASGFDLLDDGRGMGLVDWDQDGDLDVWIANRSGPRIRFMRNDAPATDQYLAIKLVGTTSNRDAIGARLELHLAGQDKRALIRTLRAGEGYLGQSSKWVHFGLGEARQIEKLVVRWPSGTVEEFSFLKPGCRYKLVEGATSRQLSGNRTINLNAKPCQSSSSAQARIVLSNRQPMPDLIYTDFARQPHRLTEHQGRPFLLNVWASWCTPCVQELTELAQSQDRLQIAGLEVVAFNFDGVGNATDSDPLDARRLLKRIDAPFHEAQGTPLVARTLEMGLRYYFDKAESLPLPCSFLVDRSFRVAVIYLGPVSVEQLLADTGILTAPPAAWQKASLPFPGRWAIAPLEDPLAAIASSRQDSNPQQHQNRSGTTWTVISMTLLFLTLVVSLLILRWRSQSRGTHK